MTYLFLFALVFISPCPWKSVLCTSLSPISTTKCLWLSAPSCLFSLFFWEVDRVGYHGEKPHATSHRLNSLSPTGLEVRHLQNVYDPNSDQQHVKETRQLYGTILASNDANPLCDSIKNKNKNQLKGHSWKVQNGCYIVVCSAQNNSNVNQVVLFYLSITSKYIALCILRSHWIMTTADLIPTSCTSTGNHTPVYLLMQLRKLDYLVSMTLKYTLSFYFRSNNVFPFIYGFVVIISFICTNDIISIGPHQDLNRE